MTLKEELLESAVVSAIAGISALTAIAATHAHFPELFDLYTVGLATALAFCVRFATLKEYAPEE